MTRPMTQTQTMTQGVCEITCPCLRQGRYDTTYDTNTNYDTGLKCSRMGDMGVAMCFEVHDERKYM